MNISIDNIIPIPIRNHVGESPCWDEALQIWYWLDQAGKIYSYSPQTHLYTEIETKQKLGSMVLQQNGNLLVAAQDTIFTVNKENMTDVLSVHHPHQGIKFADGKCDRQGRFIVSTMNADIRERKSWGNWFSLKQSSEEYHLKQIHSSHYIIPNGSAFSPDGELFYFSETDSQDRKIFQCRYDIDDGVITDITPYITFKDNSLGRPDGATVDVDGCYWSCCLDEGLILRITPQGKIDKIIKTPMKKPTMCMFGGRDYKTLFITSLCRGEHDLLNDPYAGKVLLIDTHYQGIPETRFKEVL
ncbi:SMP-30/gluconolactonase/LRE family protein [Spirabiliibacterium falconis]|uniref:SMP-30/gluconolactonase/LRE family protein n=1 Tax=Spirabiliibacterium falconis TaxID=572023 RepID=UPI001AAD48F2|nr:SMP-30/gluconolactonase/LRE family protein [Spirabiliibacterium falconis]MBE2893500.1 SMP-30/gluconolactonase/LRE family protein [Spirabiliibacterium falconis]